MGASFTTSSAGLITAAVGISLPTAGGTPSTLDYYQEESLSLNMTGPIATNIAMPLKIVRNGNIVTLKWDPFNATRTVASKQWQSTTTLPTRYNPTQAVRPLQPAWVIDGANASSYVVGSVTIDLDGTFRFEAATRGNFAGTVSGVVGGTFSYVID